METIVFTKEKVKALRKIYEQAQEGALDTFMFEGHEYAIGYAKYLLEYLEGKWKD